MKLQELPCKSASATRLPPSQANHTLLDSWAAMKLATSTVRHGLLMVAYLLVIHTSLESSLDNDHFVNLSLNMLYIFLYHCPISCTRVC